MMTDMKKIRIFAIIAMAVMAVCCAKEPIEQNKEQIDVPEGYKLLNFTASITKTAISADDTTPAWVAGDQVKFVWDGGSQVAAATAAGSSTTFNGILIPETVTEIYAVYPAAASNGYTAGSGVTVSFPAEISTGDFAGSDICVARATSTGNVWNTTLSFSNVACLVKVGVTSSVSKIVVKGLAGENIAGDLALSIADNGTVSYGDVANAAASVTAAGLTQPGSFYLPVLPGVALSSGFSVEMWNGDTALTPFVYPASVTTAAGKILGLPGLDQKSGNYYVTVAGAGNHSGVSFANALSKDEFKSMITKDDPILSGATFHFSAEEFDFGGYVTTMFSTATENVKITIEGDAEGETVFLGGENYGALEILDKTDITVKNVKFTGVNSTSGGKAALRINKTGAAVTLDSCDFIENNNTSTGAAIMAMKTYLTIINCKFSGNSASAGPAIYIGGVMEVSVKDSEFSDNTASDYGGAIWNGTGKLEVSGGSFTCNTAVKRGGAVYLHGSDVVAEIDGTSFSANGECTDSDEGQGGAIWVGGGAAVDVNDCEFATNSARVGGAVGCANDSNVNTLNVDGCTFSENSTTGVGGAMILTSKGSFNISDCSFTSNQSGGNGGAIRCDNANGTFTFDNVTFKSNYASGSGIGGGLYMDNGTYRFNKCCFNGNHGTTSGAFYIGSTSRIYLNSCLFTGNYCSGTHGTSMRVWGTNVQFFMNNCTFADDTYCTNGSASGKNCCWIYMKNKKSVLSNNTIIGYSRKGTGGATSSGGAQLIYFDASGATSNVTFVNNIIAHRNSKGSYNVNAGTVTLTAVL